MRTPIALSLIFALAAAAYLGELYVNALRALATP